MGLAFLTSFLTNGGNCGHISCPTTTQKIKLWAARLLLCAVLSSIRAEAAQDQSIMWAKAFLNRIFLFIKFIYSEKATKFCEIFPLLLTVCAVVKSKERLRKILWPSQNIWTLQLMFSFEFKFKSRWNYGFKKSCINLLEIFSMLFFYIFPPFFKNCLKISREIEDEFFFVEIWIIQNCVCKLVETLKPLIRKVIFCSWLMA